MLCLSDLTIEEWGMETSPIQSSDNKVEVDLQATREENFIEEVELQSDGLNDGSACTKDDDENDEEQLENEDYLEKEIDHEDEHKSSMGINLFVDLGHSMGLEIDQSTIRDLCNDFLDDYF